MCELLNALVGFDRKLLMNALIGFTSSVVSDSISNSLRVVKTTRQTYGQTIRCATTNSLRGTGTQCISP